MIAGKLYKISLRFPSKINKSSVKALFLTEKRTLWISADVYYIYIILRLKKKMK